MENEHLRLLVAVYSFVLLFSVIQIVSLWRIFKKAGQPGWASIVPFYNVIIMLRIVSKPDWWIVLYFIPVVNIIISVWVTNLLAHRFGRTTGFTLGLILLSPFFYPLLAFKEYIYFKEDGSESEILEDSEDTRNKYIIWALIIFIFGSVFFLIGNNLMKEFYKLFYLYLPVIALINVGYFLFGISPSRKYKTAGIVLGICLILLNLLANLIPEIKAL